MSGRPKDSVQCIADGYVEPLKIYGGEAFLELTLELIDGSEVCYLVSRSAVRSMLLGLTLATKLAKSRRRRVAP